MKGEEIPDQHNIARYCYPKYVRSDGTVEAGAFMLRLDRPDEESLSVNWLEYLRCSNRENAIAALRNKKTLILSRNGRIAVLNVGEMRQEVKTGSPDGTDLQVIHEPAENDPSHSGIFNLTRDASREFIAALIVSAISNVYPARNS